MNIVLSSSFLQMQKWSQNDQAICPYLLATNKKTTSNPTEKYDQNTWIYISLQNKHIIPISMRIVVQHH